MLTNSCLKVASKFSCEKCYYFTDKKSSYDKHLSTSKHIKLTSVNEFSNKSCNIDVVTDIKEFICDNCNKPFKSRVGLWKHKKNCIVTNKESNNKPSNKDINEPTDKELILMLIKENAEMKNMMMKVIENGTTNNSHNTTTNSHNKAFNLNFFLNETCKDAMNITDFVDSIKLEFSDLEKVGEVGYIEGISNIIIKNLNALDETKRPVHCTDKKRETIYIKDEGQWEKEDDNKTKIKRLISKVSSKNSRLLSQYREKYPDCKKCDSNISDKFNKMVIEAMGGPGENNVQKEEKIIRNISNATTISRNNL